MLLTVLLSLSHTYTNTIQNEIELYKYKSPEPALKGSRVPPPRLVNISKQPVVCVRAGAGRQALSEALLCVWELGDAAISIFITAYGAEVSVC